MEPAVFKTSKISIRVVKGFPVCLFDETDSELGYRADTPIRSQLTPGDKVVTCGLMGELRMGTVVKADAKHALVDDGGAWWYPEFDKDDRHGWTVYAFADKRTTDSNGNVVL